MHTVFALLCFVVVIHWLIFPYPSGLLHWHCGNLTIAPVPAKQPWWIWISTSCEISMNDYITTTKQSTTKPCACFLGYTVCKHFETVFIINTNAHDSYFATVYPKKHAHGFVVLCFVVVMQSFIMNSHEVFIHIHQGCFAGTGAIDAELWWFSIVSIRTNCWIKYRVNGYLRRPDAHVTSQQCSEGRHI